MKSNSDLCLAFAVFTQLTPALHGLYRAISSTSFDWSTDQWTLIANQLSKVCSPEMVDRLNNLLGDIGNMEDLDDQQFIDTFLARYVSRGRPLSGYFIVCCIIETEWTILAQALAPPLNAATGTAIEAAAANKAWNALMRNPAEKLDITNKETIATLKSTIEYATQCFTDLMIQVEDMDAEPSIDTYTWETMSESLVSFAYLRLAELATYFCSEIGFHLFCGTPRT